MKRSEINLLFVVIEVLLSFSTVCAVCLMQSVSKQVVLVVGILSLLNSFCFIISYFLNTDKIFVERKKLSELRIIEDIDFLDIKEKEKRVPFSSKDSIVFEKILYSLQLIEMSSGYLNILDTVEKRITASRIINDNVEYIKKIIGVQDNSGVDRQSGEIPFELSAVSPETAMCENITVGIYGPKDEKNYRLRLIIQSFGFFCYILPTKEEVLFSIEDKLVQFLIIQPSNKTDDAFILCKKIREKYSLLDLPILALVNKYHSYLIKQYNEMEINDFIIQPFDVSELITRILSLLNYRKIYQENTNLVLSEKEKRTFLYFITHNINTPLTILLNELHELSEFENQDPKLDTILFNVHESVNQIDSIVQNVLNSYKLSDGRMMVNQRVLDINEIINLENIYLEKKASRKNQSFETTFDSDEIQVFCDENSLKCIYTNLVDNAIKYAPINGKIKIKVFTDETNTILQVMDNGKGVPKEKQMLIFNRFADVGSIPTGKEKSLGLGLYVVNEMCKLNGLELTYEDNTQEETGSCFIVKFSKLS